MSNEIIQSIIEAVGTIIAAALAAIIAAKSASKIVKENTKSQFRTYSDKSHDVTDILFHSKQDVFIAVAVGDIFLKKYLSCLDSLLKRGIRIKYLLQTEEKLQETESYIHGQNINIDFRSDVIDKLNELKVTYADLFEWREFNLVMTASYICVDSMPIPPSDSYSSTSVVQTMLYQYRVEAEKSPITYISPKSDEKVFVSTVKCLKQMWEVSKTLDN